ncbi:sigma-70 family RNA polymerase sigma factor [Chitinophaga pollutisoli]|uniref:Sigma-70 family RNA polymerase sigma factor n=1 Tax=Chitinophaga pollutisoli TaxID=3133966 RepID=A0ABZ2YRP0_9BACT
MPILNNMPPAADPVWEAFRQGDRDAFAQLYDEHAPPLIVYGIRVSRDEGMVRDAIQDLFIELWRSRGRIPAVGSVRGYLLKALRYKLMRKAGVRMRYADTLPDQADPVHPEAILLEQEDESLRRQRIREAIGQLPQRQQEMINLRFYQGLSTEEAAEIMAIHYQSAANLLHRGVTHLRQLLGPNALALIILLREG